jgi:hypothetical protein
MISETDQRTPACRALDEKIAAEPQLPAPALPPDAAQAPVEDNLGRLRRRPRLITMVGVFTLFVAGGFYWQFCGGTPIITEPSADRISRGMSAAEVRKILGGPAGNCTGRARVTYARGGIGEDTSGFYEGTNWWGLTGMIQVHFDKEGLVKSAVFYEARSVQSVGFWDELVDLFKGHRFTRHQHDWVAAHW